MQSCADGSLLPEPLLGFPDCSDQLGRGSRNGTSNDVVGPIPRLDFPEALVDGHRIAAGPDSHIGVREGVCKDRIRVRIPHELAFEPSDPCFHLSA